MCVHVCVSDTVSRLVLIYRAGWPYRRGERKVSAVYYAAFEHVNAGP